MAALDKGMEHFMFASLGAKQHQMVGQTYHSRTAKPHCSHSLSVRYWTTGGFVSWMLATLLSHKATKEMRCTVSGGLWERGVCSRP